VADNQTGWVEILLIIGIAIVAVILAAIVYSM
jgi:hypothetical protein